MSDDGQASQSQSPAPQQRLQEKREQNEAVEKTRAALQLIRHAGDPRYEDRPLEALQALKEMEETMYTPVPADLAQTPSKNGRAGSYPGVQSTLRETTRNPEFESAIKSRPAPSPEHTHPGMAVVCIDRPLPSKSSTVRSGSHPTVPSRYAAIFHGTDPDAASAMFAPPPDNPRLQVAQKKEAEKRTMIPRKKAQKPPEWVPREPKTVGKDFVPRVCTIVNESQQSEGAKRRKEVEERRERFVQKLPPKPSEAARSYKAPQYANVHSAYHQLFVPGGNAEPFFVPPPDEQNPRKAAERKREEKRQNQIAAAKKPERPRTPSPKTVNTTASPSPPPKPSTSKTQGSPKPPAKGQRTAAATGSSNSSSSSSSSKVVVTHHQSSSKTTVTTTTSVVQDTANDAVDSPSKETDLTFSSSEPSPAPSPVKEQPDHHHQSEEATPPSPSQPEDQRTIAPAPPAAVPTTEQTAQRDTSIAPAAKEEEASTAAVPEEPAATVVAPPSPKPVVEVEEGEPTPKAETETAAATPAE